MPNEVPKPNVEDSLRRDEGAPRKLKHDSEWPIVLGFLVVLILVVGSSVFLAIRNRQLMSPRTYDGPFRLGMTYDEAKKHLPSDNYLSKVFHRDDRPRRGEPVWYTLDEDEEHSQITLQFSADKKLVRIITKDVLLEDDSLKAKHSK